MKVLVLLPMFIAFYYVLKMRKNDYFMKSLKVFLWITIVNQIVQILIDLITNYNMLYYNEDLTMRLENISRYTALISDYILLPSSLVGILILLYGLVQSKESSDSCD